MGFIFQKEMVLYFKPLNEKFIVYMGKDKHENEELIKYGFPIDIWFHVDNLSSAHVYLRLAEGYTIDNITKETLEECLQLVKENSIEGCKKERVSIVYTPWENLLKKSSMEVGQVGFKSEKAVYKVHKISKVKDVLKRIDKTMVVKDVDLEAERDAYMKEQSNIRKKIYEDNQKQELEEAKKRKEEYKEKTYAFMDKVGEETTNKDDKDIDDDFW